MLSKNSVLLHHFETLNFFFSAFDYLLKNLEDLVLDTPDAPTILGNFMARAIADDCIPPKFILSYKGNVCSEMAGKFRFLKMMYNA